MNAQKNANSINVNHKTVVIVDREGDPHAMLRRLQTDTGAIKNNMISLKAFGAR